MWGRVWVGEAGVVAAWRIWFRGRGALLTLEGRRRLVAAARAGRCIEDRIVGARCAQKPEL